MSIIIKPLLTEKVLAKGEKQNTYGFIVDKTANKIQVRNAVEKMYNVTVYSVNTMRYAGRLKSRFTKAGVITGKTNAFKKAFVTLVEGNKIDFFNNI